MCWPPTPVVETVADPRPVHVLDGAGGRSHLMLQFMDLSEWNPTFHAPHERNGWLGFDTGAPGVDDALAYAYTYVVAEPEPSNCPDGVVPDRLPVILDLHGWNGNDYPADLGPAAWYCALQVRPVDSSETWWFGFGAEADYRRGETPSGGDRIVNYTEQRILRMVHDLLRDPELGSRVGPRTRLRVRPLDGRHRGARPGPALPDRLRRGLRLRAHDRHGPLR